MPEPEKTSIDLCVKLFLECNDAIAQGALIHRASRQRDINTPSVAMKDMKDS